MGLPRLAAGTAHVRTSQMRYFDARDDKLGVKHIMAAGALPPTLPPVRIDGELYWDGGFLSNTPPRLYSTRMVQLWNPIVGEPTTMARCPEPQKGVQYSSHVNLKFAT